MVFSVPVRYRSSSAFRGGGRDGDGMKQNGGKGMEGGFTVRPRA